MADNRIRKGGIASIEELYECQVVRGEFLSSNAYPKASFECNKVVFNAKCVRLFPDTQFVSVMVDDKRQRLILEPAEEFDKGVLKFALHKKEQNHSRQCSAKVLCGKLFEMMEWNPQDRYRVMAVYQEISGKRLIVFNLDEWERMVLTSETIVNGRTRKHRDRFMPPDWKESFGDPYLDYHEKLKVDVTKKLIRVDNKTGELQEVTIEPKGIVAKDIISRQYGGSRLDNKEETEQ